MEEIGKIVTLLGVVFLLLSLLFNISPAWPRFPWDINIDRPGLKLYLPWATSLIIAIILTFLLNFFQK